MKLSEDEIIAIRIALNYYLECPRVKESLRYGNGKEYEEGSNIDVSKKLLDRLSK